MKTTTTRKRKKSPRLKVTTFRVTFDQLDHLKRVARGRDTSMSSIIRELVYSVQ